MSTKAGQLQLQANIMNAHLAVALNILKTKNLSDLWLTHCLLSLVEYFGAKESEESFNPLFPYLNLHRVSLFGDAILRSTSSDRERGCFYSADIAPVFNALTKAEDEVAVQELTGDPELQLLRFIVVRGYSQFRFQNWDMRLRLARWFALLDALPTAHRSRLEARHKNRFLDLPATFESQFGLSAREFFLCALRLMVFYKTRQDDLNLISAIRGNLLVTDLSSESGRRKVEQVLGALVDQTKSVYNTLTFDPDELLLRDDTLPLSKMEAFVQLSARTTTELRSELTGIAPSLGSYGHQLSPLEMYPIVDLGHTRYELRYVVPDFRKYEVGIAQVPHFSLLASFPGNEYNEHLGTIQEIYIEELVKERLPNCELIPELPYGKPQMLGPDLIILDPASEGLICIESKSKKLRVASKVDPLSDELLQDLEPALSALEKLPGKLEAVYEGKGRYADQLDSVGKTSDKPPICVVVVGEGLFSFSHVVHTILTKHSNHFLHSFPYPYCLMPLETFERAVEVGATHGRSLYELLHQYWKVSIDPKPKPKAAEEFDGLSIDRRESYLNRHFESLLHGAPARE